MAYSTYKLFPSRLWQQAQIIHTKEDNFYTIAIRSNMTQEESPSVHHQWPRPLKNREQINVQMALDLGDVFLTPLNIFIQKPYSLRAKTACRPRFSLKIFPDTPKYLVFRKVKEDGEHFKIHIWNQHRASFPQRIMRSQVHPRDAPHPTELPRSWSLSQINNNFCSCMWL